jgi:hypothetical protein
LVCVLVCLLIASTIAAATTQSALRGRRDIRIQHQMRQTELLLDAGVLRAARQLRRSDAYQGESWRPVNSIPRFDQARVEIRVSSDPQQDGLRQVEVTASLGGGDQLQLRSAGVTRRSHTFQVRSSAGNTDFTEPDSPSVE